MFELLGIRECVQHPVALEQGSVAGVREAGSMHFITMRLEYGVCVGAGRRLVASRGGMRSRYGQSTAGTRG